MDAELAQLEAELKKLNPAGMPDDMVARLDDAMSRWHEHVPVEEKIIPLNQSTEESSHWLGWRAVAAVAVMGAAGAFLASGGPSETPASPVAQSGFSASPNHGVMNATFTPSDARKNIVSASDRGVVWTKSGQAVRCVEVTSSQQMQFQNAKGEKYVVEKPGREVVFVPVKID